ncbi:MAG: 2Fe-2S iron-sulfur cluster binding domain-containing protein, partial [Candidatus Omnitrophica bacterium]|nr:2Fe-2S iron-sulfur cluster binding domain-containing protein [Candidatus Omnitrophota bacterium]
MTAKVRIDLTPVGDTFEVKKGTPLRDFLFDRGVEFPCGGRGECRGCRVRVAEGHLPLTDVQASILSEREIEQGWRVSCQCRAETDLTLELRGWNADILQDRTLFDFTPGEGLGVAVDIGTTTVAVQLLDLSTANVLGVRSALNIQARHGADVMSRVAYALTPEGNGTLTASIREQIGRLIRDLLKKSERTEGMSDTLSEIILVGNTAMHHLFCGLDVEPLSA